MITNLKRYHRLFSLGKNKKEDGYLYLLNSTKRILSLEDSKFINVKSIRLNFEIGLIKEDEDFFTNIRIIGSFYHFIKAIK